MNTATRAERSAPAPLADAAPRHLPHENRSLDALLAVAALVAVAVWLLEWHSGVITPWDKWMVPGLAVTLAGLRVVLRTWPQRAFAVRVALVLVLGSYFAFTTLMQLFRGADPTSWYQLATAALWLPMGYACAFVFLPPRWAMAASVLFFVALHGPVVAGIASGVLVRNLGNEFPSFAGVMAGAHVGYVVLLRMVARSRAEHLLTAQRMQLMAELASTDVLTTLLNRRATAEALAQAVALFQRHGTPLSVALIDIDHFKRVNDHHGHAAGDRVLAETAQRLRRVLRTEDTLGRWGGEEFLLVLPQTPLEGAMGLAERLREALASTPYPHGEPVTASIGVTQVGVGDDPHVAIARADRALYRAKALGRNRVESCEAPGS